jgi:hypothetical protein
MTQSYTVNSVDTTNNTMLVTFTENSNSITLNLPLPPVGQALDQFVQLMWPNSFFSPNTTGAAAANAILGVAQTPVITLTQAQASQTALITNTAQAYMTGGYVSSALGEPYTYPSQVTDQLNMVASVTDALLTSPTWQVNTSYIVGSSVTVTGNVRLLCTTAGISALTEPTGAGTDGTVVWIPWVTPFMCADVNNVWAARNHTASQIIQAGTDGKAFIVNARNKLATLLAEIQSAETVVAVTNITWN